MKKILTIISLLLIQLNSNAQWMWQNGMPPRQNILKILHVDQDNIFSVGEKGLIIKSADDGLSWFPQKSNTELTLRDIIFIDNEFGFAIGDNGIILKTTNFGETWIKKESEINNNLRAICNFNINNFWICGDSGLIIYTSDSGESWEIQNPGINGVITDIHFSNLNDGCAIGLDGSFLYTSDGGTNWISNLHSSYKLRALDFIDDNNGFVVSSSIPIYPLSNIESNVWKTTDKGKTWSNLNTNILDVFPKDIKFISAEVGFIAGYGLAAGLDYSVIYKTVNGGYNWEQVFTGPSIHNFNNISIRNYNSAVAVTNKGYMYNTSNSGDNWNLMYEDKFYGYLNSSDFQSEYEGWVVGTTGFYVPGSSSVLLKTIDGGISWVEKLRLNDIPLTKIFFINSSNGWLGGYSGALFRTTDGGENWTSHNLDSSGTIWDIFFINETIGWIIHGRRIKKTTDGGAIWFVQKEFPLNNIRKIFFVDQNNGWLTLSDYNLGKVFRTTNGGVDWIDMGNSSGFPMNDVYFLDRFKGWAVAGGDGELWFTNDGGINWELNGVGYNENLKSVFFIDSLKGFICGSSGLILKTANGGTTWEKYTTNTPNTLNYIKFANPNCGWIVGDEGIIIKTTNGGLTFVNEKNKPISNFLLSQNYPNPFNPTTRIEYRVGSIEKVTLKVYDVLGREVATLVNEEKLPGVYEVEFNPASGIWNLASGIYYYQLKAGNFIETKKMIYLK